MPHPTLRSLAKELGLSRTTVSDALRGSPRVKADTVSRVRAAAAAAGYVRNPLTGTVMSLLRRSSGQEFRGVIGALEMVAADRPLHAAHYSEALLVGVHRRAAELGFKVERFKIGPNSVSLKRLDTILLTRGIKALILLPSAGFPDFSALTWSRYTGVYTDYYINHPPLHCVCSDHYRSMVALLQALHARGYRRPGLFMEVPIDERLQYRWEGAFAAMQTYLPDIETVPPLLLRGAMTRDALVSWFHEYKPDVVFGHETEALRWLRAAGVRVPEQAAFVCLNSLRAPAGCAALHFQADQLGSRATELVTAQLLQNEFGIPAKPSLTTLDARWVEGETILRAKPPAAKPAPPRRAAPRKYARLASPPPLPQLPAIHPGSATIHPVPTWPADLPPHN